MIIDVNLEQLCKILDKIPVLDFYIPIEIKMKNFDIIKVNGEEVEFSLYKRNMPLIKKKRVKIDEFKSIFKKYNLDTNDNLSPKIDILKLMQDKNPIQENVSGIVWAFVFPLIFIGSYLIIIKELSIVIRRYYTISRIFNLIYHSIIIKNG